MIEEVVAQSAVATGAGTERLELGRAAPRRFCANLEDAAHVVRQVRIEQLSDRGFVDAVRLDATRAQPRQQARGLGGRLDHAAGEPAHLGVELRLSFRDQRLGSLDQLEVDRYPALVDPGVEQEHLALGIGQRTQSLMERSLYLDILPTVGDEPRGPCPGRPTSRSGHLARSGAGAPSAASADGRRCPFAPADRAPWPPHPDFGAVPWRRQARRCSATARVSAPASRTAPPGRGARSRARRTSRCAQRADGQQSHARPAQSAADRPDARSEWRHRRSPSRRTTGRCSGAGRRPTVRRA